MTQAPKQLSFTARTQNSSKKSLSFTRRELSVLKISPRFWNRQVSNPKTKTTSIFRECPSFCKIRFTTDTSAMPEKYTRASTNRSYRKTFGTGRTLSCEAEAVCPLSRPTLGHSAGFCGAERAVWVLPERYG